MPSLKIEYDELIFPLLYLIDTGIVPEDVTEDLEDIAKKLWPLINKVHSMEICKDIDFEGALKDVSSSIQSLPEWMGADYERCMFGPMTTKCFLQWEWLTVEADKNSAVSFIKRIIKVDNEEEKESLGCT